MNTLNFVFNMEFEIGNVIIHSGRITCGKKECDELIQAIRDGDKDFEFEHSDKSPGSDDWYENPCILTFKKEGEELLIESDCMTVTIKYTKKLEKQLLAYLEAQF